MLCFFSSFTWKESQTHIVGSDSSGQELCTYLCYSVIFQRSEVNPLGKPNMTTRVGFVFTIARGMLSKHSECPRPFSPDTRLSIERQCTGVAFHNSFVSMKCHRVQRRKKPMCCWNRAMQRGASSPARPSQPGLPPPGEQAQVPPRSPKCLSVCDHNTRLRFSLVNCC